MSVGDVAYWDNSKVRIISKDKWNNNLGTPIGVVVIPEGMLPDSKARIVALNDFNGTYSLKPSSNNPNLQNVPTTDNAGSTTIGSAYYGHLPSDNFSGTTSFVDPKAKYNNTINLIPSPYLDDDKILNPEYCKELEKGNALSDFNGLENTLRLGEINNKYNLQWYFPAAGELGFLMARFKVINNIITQIGGNALTMLTSPGYYGYQSSTMDTVDVAWRLDILEGIIFSESYDMSGRYLREFACL